RPGRERRAWRKRTARVDPGPPPPAPPADSAIGTVTVVVLLHLFGWVSLLAFVGPRHYSLGNSGTFGVGLGVTAYTLGMRHAFDARPHRRDRNTTRKLMAERQRPLTVGFWFALGHSSVVFIGLLNLAIMASIVRVLLQMPRRLRRGSAGRASGHRGLLNKHVPGPAHGPGDPAQHLGEWPGGDVGLFVVVWIAALAVWKVGRIEEKWDAGAVGRGRPQS
ncbi:MAG: HoxN/HupN/NixA family nickel/cobalt transporter, partial [Isosphaeraceae bacterium]